MSNRPSTAVLPPAPVDLVAVAIGGSQVILAWTECGGGAGGLGFRIERTICNDPCSQFMDIGCVGPHIAAYRDGSVEHCTTYRYRVHAWNAFGDSLPSNVVEVKTPQVEAERSSDKE